MKTIKLNLIKKNRMYFSCKNESGYECKLKINEKSENLEIGIHNLLVNDLSIRSNYGTNLIYEVVTEVKKDNICTLQHFRYNENLVKSCRELGGKWDENVKSWIFPNLVEKEVEELDYLYNSEIISVEIEAKDYISSCQNSIKFFGYTIARAKGRDTGATLGEGVSKISGAINSGGSMKNWRTDIDKGSIFRLKVSKNIISNEDCESKWIIKIL